MNKRLWRCICVFLVLLLILSCTACGRSVGPTQTTAPNPTSGSTRPTLAYPTSPNPTGTIPSVTGPTPVPDGAMLYADDGAYYAPYVGVGCHEVSLKRGMNYVLFVAAEAGEYVFSIPGFDGTIGYYGRADFVQTDSLVEVVDNTVTVTVREGMFSSDDPNAAAFVIGIGPSVTEQNCTLVVERIGDPAWDVSDEPWIVYEPTVDLVSYTLPEDAELVKFDLYAPSDAYDLVLNPEDGFYHLNSTDGPLVLMYLTRSSGYLDDLAAVARVSNLCRYYYDADGNFMNRETYNACILQYAAKVENKSGVYPLTEDLMYIIYQHGEHYGWYDPLDFYSFLFRDENGEIDERINPEIAWLFACCYLKLN